MPFALNPDLPRELAPLAWLVGRWEGAGVVGYPTMDSLQFGQEIECGHDGRPFLSWRSRTWLLDAAGNQVRPLATELGFWRPLDTQADGSNVELLLAHPTGFVELYAGVAGPGRIEIRTDGVMRSPVAKDYSAGARMYGLVEGRLMWVMEMAAMGRPLQSHASAELKRVA